MSITSADDRITTYSPVVATTTFAADFPVFDNDDIAVYVDGIEREDFAVSATYVQGISNDARAVFNPGITGIVQVVGARDPRRTNRFVNGAPLQIWQQNLALDTLEAEMQEVDREARRAHRAPFGTAGGVFDASDLADAANNAHSARIDAERAEQAKIDAINFASGLNLPPITVADVGKYLSVNDLGTGYTARPFLRTDFDTIAQAAAAFIPIPRNFVHVAGYYLAGDGGGAVYKRVALQPSHGAAFQSADGAWWELSHDGRINVRQTGVSESNSANKAAFERAAAALGAIGGELIIPPGTFFISGGSWIIANKSIKLTGSGVRNSRIIFATAGSGIVWSSDTIDRALTVKDLTISTSAGGGTALYANITIGNQGSSWKNCTIRDVFIDSQDYDVAHGVGLRFTNIAGLTVDNCFIRGKFSEKSSIGVLCDGWTVDMKISNSIFSFHDFAMQKRGSLEGFNVYGCIGLSCKNFIDIGVDNTTANTEAGVWGSIRNCHSGCSNRVLNIRGYPQTFIEGNLFYADGNAFNSHIYIDNCNGVTITGNTLTIGDGTQGWGINAQNINGAIITNNTINGRFFPMEIKASCQKIIISLNRVDKAITVSTTNNVVNVNNLVA